MLFSWLQDNYYLTSVTSHDRGTETERRLVVKLLKSGIHFQTIFHDLYITNSNGKYAQIDVVLATKVGIIVIEVKKFSGWIFGNGNQSNWTQILAYGKQKYRFYNPVFQNKKHIEDLKKQLTQFENIPFFSVIVFYGDCLLKNVTSIPKETRLVKHNSMLQIIKEIIAENEPAKYTNKREIIDLLKQAVKMGESKYVRDNHIENSKSIPQRRRYE